MEDQQVNKKHNKRLTGRKAVKKQSKEKIDNKHLNDRQRNPKAFAFQSVVKAERSFRRSQDITTKKHHIPLINRTPLEPPPIIVAAVGPPKVGKTTLLKCLIKNFTHQNLISVQGPITIVTAKKQRVTFIECNNDINAMIDIAKVADLVLLLIDASFGFEMETFEFLNICTVHGMPRIMGILTHLDSFRQNKILRRVKKKLKHRFWTEIYPGAKLFYLSGMVYDEYQKTEVHNLGRFILCMKFRPLQWRSTHPYILADRVEDLTDPELIRKQPKCDRTVCLYGYMRGAYLKNKSSIHIPGCGDFFIQDISFLPDPCPLPDKLKKRSLNQKERLIYAPLAGIGGILYDKDAVYVDVRMNQSHSEKAANNESENPESRFISSLIKTQELLDSKIAVSQLSLFSNTAPISSEEVEINPAFLNQQSSGDKMRKRRKMVFTGASDNEEDSEMSEDDNKGGDDDEETIRKENFEISQAPESQMSDEELVFDDDSGDDIDFDDSKLKSLLCADDYNLEDVDDDVSLNHGYNNSQNNMKKRVRFQVDDEDILDKKEKDSDSGMEDDHFEESALRWKNDLGQKAMNAFYKRQMDTTNLKKLVYGAVFETPSNQEDEVTEIGGIFKVAQSKHQEKSSKDNVDCTKSTSLVQDWSLEKIRDTIKDCFVTGKWKASEDMETLLKAHEDDTVYGDFEDLETGKVFGKKEEDEKDENEENNKSDKELIEPDSTAKGRTLKQQRLERKRKLKEMFNSEYDSKDNSNYYNEWKEEFAQQAQLNKSEFENVDDNLRVQYEGFRPGMYVRIEIEKISYEFIKHFDPTYPYIVGGLQSGEENIGCVQVRFKKHRWYKKILKNRDPLIISLGWRRFQTIPLFSIQDHNMRNRLLKYTPQHLFCHASFWGPITPQGAGILAVQNVAEITHDFRIAATGGVVHQDKSLQIMKKLKLIGYPYEVHKRTAFIKGMFNSFLEAAKFEGATIRSVSGIRGQIKKAVKKYSGAFRATFEDKLLLQDIVFVRTWYPVEVPTFYTPLTNLLLPLEEKNKWQGMHTVGQLRKLKGIRNEANPDSLYKPIVRKPFISRQVKIPKQLQKQLPYKDKPKFPSKKKGGIERVAVVLEPKEQKVMKLMKMVKMLHRAKEEKRVKDMKERVITHKKKLEEEELIRIQKQKQMKKRIFGAIHRLQTKRHFNKT